MASLFVCVAALDHLTLHFKTEIIGRLLQIAPVGEALQKHLHIIGA
jgi:hypothetical protein